jgi:hypothetical protein
LRSVYKILSEPQTRIIKRAKIGNILNVQFKEPLYASVTEFMADKVDVTNYTLVLGPEEASVIIKFYEGGKKVFELKNRGKEFDVEAKLGD